MKLEIPFHFRSMVLYRNSERALLTVAAGQARSAHTSIAGVAPERLILATTTFDSAVALIVNPTAIGNNGAYPSIRVCHVEISRDEA
jgi:hypothetical protein